MLFVFHTSFTLAMPALDRKILVMERLECVAALMSSQLRVPFCMYACAQVFGGADFRNVFPIHFDIDFHLLATVRHTSLKVIYNPEV